MQDSVKWERIGESDPELFRDAVQQLHWAVQLVSEVAWTYLDWTPPDDSHTSMVWSHALDAFVGRPIHERDLLCAALRPYDLTLLVVDPECHCLERFPLSGATLDAAYEWMASALDRASSGRLTVPIRQRGIQIPPHDVGRGRAFRLHDQAAFLEVARWYRNAAYVLEALRKEQVAAKPVTCWPHQFDIATLITVCERIEAQPKKLIGVGMAPMGAGIEEPYWYVGPWPRPTALQSVPPLPSGGYWHTRGWCAAILRASRLLPISSPSDQLQSVRDFLHSAVASAYDILSVGTCVNTG